MLEIDKVPAREAMQGDLAQLYPDSSIADAVATFEEYRIGGAPVVDRAGELVGVLSASDIVRSGRVAEGDHGMEIPAGPSVFDGEEGGFSKEDYDLEVLNRKMVSDWMTLEVTTVSPDATLLEVCQILAKNRLHRVFVTEGRKLTGVVSTFDVVEFLTRHYSS